MSQYHTCAPAAAEWAAAAEAGAAATATDAEIEVGATAVRLRISGFRCWKCGSGNRADGGTVAVAAAAVVAAAAAVIAAAAAAADAAAGLGVVGFTVAVVAVARDGLRSGFENMECGSAAGGEDRAVMWIGGGVTATRDGVRAAPDGSAVASETVIATPLLVPAARMGDT